MHPTKTNEDYLFATRWFGFESLDEILRVTIQIKSPEPYFHVVLVTLLYKVVLMFEYVDEILKCDEQ